MTCPGPAPIFSDVITAILMVEDERDASVPVFGTPAARRLVALARRLGAGAVHVVSRSAGARNRSLPFLSDLLPPDAFHMVAGPEGAPVFTAELALGPDDQVLVMRANHVVDALSLETLTRAGSRGECRWCCRDEPGDGEWFERIWLAAGDCASDLLAAILSGDPHRHVIPGEKVPVSPGLPMVVTEKTAKAAEERLMSALGLATQSHDSFMSRSINRRLSRPLSRKAARTKLTANFVTVFNIAIGLAGAFLLAMGGYWAQLLGAVLFLASTILDGVDGEVARLKLQESTLGHYLDISGDNAVHVAVFVGIALGLYRHTNETIYLTALAVLLAGFALCAFAVQKALGHGPDRRNADHFTWLTSLLVNRDFAYLVAVCALTGQLRWFLFGAAIGVYLFAFALLALVLKRARPAWSGSQV